MGLARSVKQYLGVRAILPPDLQTAKRAPTSGDKAYIAGTLWLDTVDLTAFMWSGTSWIALGTGATGGVVTLTGDSGGAISPVGGNIDILGGAGVSVVGTAGTLTISLTGGGEAIDSMKPDAGTDPVVPDAAGLVTMAGTANQITTTGALNKLTFSIPAVFTAPGSIASTTGLTAGTTFTATGGASTFVGTFHANITGAATTVIGTGGTGAVQIGNATGNTAVTGSLTASTTLTATSGAITATNGNLVATAIGTGILLNSNQASGVAASPVVVNGRSGRATFTTVSIAAAADLTLTLTNSAITASTTEVMLSMSGATTGSALSIKSKTASAGSLAIVVTNGTGATTSTADIQIDFLILNA